MKNIKIFEGQKSDFIKLIFLIFEITKQIRIALDLYTFFCLVLSLMNINRWWLQARSQKFAMGVLFWGSGGGAPNRRRPVGLWGRRLMLSKILHLFEKLLNFRAILTKNNAFKTCHRNWQRYVI